MEQVANDGIPVELSRYRASHRQIAFLPGKPLARKSVLAEVVERLHRLTPTIILHHASKHGAIPDLLYGSQLVVQRGLNQDQLDLATGLERAGVRCFNRIAATCSGITRAGILTNLAAAGIRFPETSVVATWSEVLETSRQQAIVVKIADESTGRGQGVLIAADGGLPDEQPFRGPYIVQEYIPNNGTVQKLYVAGNQVRGLFKERRAKTWRKRLRYTVRCRFPTQETRASGQCGSGSGNRRDRCASVSKRSLRDRCQSVSGVSHCARRGEDYCRAPRLARRGLNGGVNAAGPGGG